MSTKQMLIREIEALPAQIIDEVYNFVSFLKIRNIMGNENSDILFASENTLATDWLLPEEDIAWENL